jgi:outer membrane lipoprotein SlyB
MNQTAQQTRGAARIHPLMAAAAISVIAISALGASAFISQQVKAGAGKSPETAVADAAGKAAGDLAAPTAPRAAVAPAKPKPAATPAAPAKVAAAPAVCNDCGTVTGVRSVKVAGEGTGVGAVAGGVVGGVIGNQIGGGSGRDVARVVGAVGGAVAGHQIEKQARSTVSYLVDVKLDSGATRTVRFSAPPSYRAGDRVRLDGNSLRQG